MEWKKAGSARSTVSATLGMGALSIAFALFSGCGGKVDDRFSAETYDEYTEPLTNAVIGTPAGVVTVGLGGEDASAGTGGAGSSLPVISGSSSSGSSSSGVGFGGGSTDGGVLRDGGFVEGGPGDSGGTAQWSFDDCSPTSNFLVDTTGGGANAQHALGSSCVPGISGLGVQFRTAKDVVQVPDEPEFTVSTRVAVAAWVKPTTVNGDQPIVIKRLKNETAFSLGIHNGNIEMSVVLTNGTTVISRAPISPGVFTHVAGMYDGTFVFLFINGQQFGQVFAGGTLRNVFAPVRIGATTQSQHFSGIIDEVFLSTADVSAAQLTALACITKPSTLAVTPAAGAPVPFDTPVHYDIVATDNDVGFCQPKSYEVFFENVDSGITTSFDNNQFVQLSPGQSTDFGVDVSGSDSADPGVHLLTFVVDAFGSSFPFAFEQLFGQLSFTLEQPTGCFVQTRRELMITATSVVDDPIRTFGSSNAPTGGINFFPDGGVASSDAGVALPPDAGNDPSLGVWSFGHLMREMAPTPDQAPAMVLQLLQHWLTSQTVNGFPIDARTRMQAQVIDLWPKTPTGDLDLDQSPLTLEAIVNRIDLRDLSKGSAGEGRFVFGVNGPLNFGSFTVIVEYTLPAQTAQDVADWAARWHALSSLTFPSEDYNAALEAITRRFTDHGVVPGAVNGSALVELRTNEIALSDIGEWELRSFVLSASGTGFDETTVKETPDFGADGRAGFNNTQTLADFANQNTAAIEAVIPGAIANSVPPQFEGQNFLAGAVLNPLVSWNAPGIDTNLRFHLSTNTCNGCHGPDTNTTFLMVTPRTIGSEAILSPFLTGTTAFDPFTGQTRALNDLGRRRTDLTALVCGTDGGAPPPPAADAGSPPPPLDAGVVVDSGVVVVRSPPPPPPLEGAAAGVALSLPSAL